MGLNAGVPSARGDDGLVNPVGGIVCELDQEQQLRERVVLEREAFGEPALCDGEKLREEPWSCRSVVVAEVSFKRRLGQEKATSLLRRRLRSSRVWMLDFPTMGGFRSWSGCQRWRGPA